MIKPTQADLEIYQGASFDKQWTWKADGVPVDLTGADVRAQIRPSVRSETIYLDMTLVNGRCVVHDAPGGTFGIVLDPATTAELSFSHGVYDLEIEFPDGHVQRLLFGDVTLDREVTR